MYPAHTDAFNTTGYGSHHHHHHRPARPTSKPLPLRSPAGLVALHTLRAGWPVEHAVEEEEEEEEEAESKRRRPGDGKLGGAGQNRSMTSWMVASVTSSTDGTCAGATTLPTCTVLHVRLGRSQQAAHCAHPSATDRHRVRVALQSCLVATFGAPLPQQHQQQQQHQHQPSGDLCGQVRSSSEVHVLAVRSPWTWTWTLTWTTVP
ncbi:hypothetical protein IWZ03DRAFT_375948 [Phyllosticta citriasiana]|uniref:Uncharacterized protein n=1 Tax=Phyllosticta citriasiana TaxID=595635 RepID=A0ABR1KLG2_9PEZI